jgi:hypothetical protein
VPWRSSLCCLISTAALLGCGSAATPAADGAGPDVAEPEAAPPDLAEVAAPDAGVDALGAAPDAAPPDLAPDVAAAPTAYPRPTYKLLSETGLYADVATWQVAPGIEEFHPTYTLWSDGAEKRRWVQLPPGTRIDTSNMNRWVFPVGTRFFKEFAIGGVLLETRLVERYGTGPEDYWMGAFVWKADQSDAVFAADGQADINGTSHDAPPQKHCGVCHNGEPGRGLGFSALQLSRKGDGLTLDALVREGRLSDPPPAGASYHPPGDPAAALALGYLHANCGHCHNLKGTSWPDTQMVLRLELEETVLEQTGVYRSVIGQRLQYWRHDGFSQRVVTGDPAASAVMYRMQTRGNRDQMPPLATEIIDSTGIDIVTRWITSLPVPLGDGGVGGDGGAPGDAGQSGDGGGSN